MLSSGYLKHKIEKYGVFMATLVLSTWLLVFVLNLWIPVSYSSPFTYLRLLLQAHLFTGLFITAHDAMHGTVSLNKKVNKFFGILSLSIHAYNSFGKMLPKHHEHHKHVASENDPDFHKGNPNFFVWYFKFLMEYVSIWQVVLVAITYNLLIVVFPQPNVLLFYCIAPLVSTLQLFYFGTYLPHKGSHEEGNPHKSRTLKKNHFWAFITCYFFGYHYEHHDAPQTPWWLLHKLK